MGFPNTIDSFQVVNGTMLLSSAGTTDHATLTNQQSTAIIAIENTLGTTSGTNVLSSFTAGQQALPIKSGTIGTIISGGTFNNLTFGTPTLQSPTITGQGTNSGTISGGVYGTATFTSGTLGTPTIQGAVVNTENIVSGAVTQIGSAFGTSLSQTITSVDNTTTGITGGSVTLTTAGNPVFVYGQVIATKDSGTSYNITYLQIDGTQQQSFSYMNGTGLSTMTLVFVSQPASGTHTWQLAGAVGNSGGTMTVKDYSLVVIEQKR